VDAGSPIKNTRQTSVARIMAGRGEKGARFWPWHEIALIGIDKGGA
jgi:hypothetical protein